MDAMANYVGVRNVAEEPPEPTKAQKLAVLLASAKQRKPAGGRKGFFDRMEEDEKEAFMVVVKQYANGTLACTHREAFACLQETCPSLKDVKFSNYYGYLVAVAKAEGKK